jgi:glutaconate CoA-transferase, subunit B
MGSEPFTAREIMIAAAAREIHDGEVVFVGMRLPLVAFAVAKELHAPANVAAAVACNGLLDVMALLQRGRVDLGFIGGAEIDRFGNLNTTSAPPVRLPGSGGAADIASFARRTVIIMTHERRRFREKLSYVTSAGHGAGGGWRRSVGLPGRGPGTVVTSLGVFGFDESGEMRLASLHPGVSEGEVRGNTGWPLRTAATLTETVAPTKEELFLIRRFDTLG